MTPEIGKRIIYFRDGKIFPAIIRAVQSDEIVDLFILDGAEDVLDVLFSDEPQDDHWSWPL